MEAEVSRMSREMKVFTRSIGKKAQEIVRENVFRPFFALWKRNCYLPTLLSSSRKEQQHNNTPGKGHIIADERYGQQFPIGMTTTERKRRSLS